MKIRLLENLNYEAIIPIDKDIAISYINKFNEKNIKISFEIDDDMACPFESVVKLVKAEFREGDEKSYDSLAIEFKTARDRWDYDELFVNISPNLFVKKYDIISDDCKFIDLKDGQPHKVQRIKALLDFADVKAGCLGGYIESTSNLEQLDKSWIYYGIVLGNSKVEKNGKVGLGAVPVYNDATLTLINTKVINGSVLGEYGTIRNSTVLGRLQTVKSADVLVDNVLILNGGQLKAKTVSNITVNGYKKAKSVEKEK